MPGMVANLVQETCPAPGTGTVQLAGVVNPGFMPWSSQFVNGSRVFYAISDGTNTEIGEGTINAAITFTLIRTTVLWNSLGTTAFINFSTQVRCWNGVPAERLGQLDDTLRLPLYDTSVQSDMGILPGPYSTITVAEDGFYIIQQALRFTTTITAASSGITCGLNMAVVLASDPTHTYLLATAPQMPARLPSPLSSTIFGAASFMSAMSCTCPIRLRKTLRPDR